MKNLTGDFKKFVSNPTQITSVSIRESVVFASKKEIGGNGIIEISFPEEYLPTVKVKDINPAFDIFNDGTYNVYHEHKSLTLTQRESEELGKREGKRDGFYNGIIEWGIIDDAEIKNNFRLAIEEVAKALDL